MVLGTCTLEKLIGRGSVGAVFLAQQSRPRRQVAVKVLLPMTAAQPSQHAAFLARFRRETDAAALLGHPNIVPVHEYGERDGLAYLVMAYISGGTLRDELVREGRLPLTKVVSYLEQMASALDFAHQRGVIHRDIKPANILLTPEKRLLLTDFGLVKIVAEGHVSLNPLSGLDMPMGTPDYMAPEQVLGSEGIDARADIYSLGVLVYHMVTGVVPFTSNSPMQVALQHLHSAPPSPRIHRPDLPAAAEEVILHAMAQLPENRYPCARDFAVAFRRALETAGVLLDTGYFAAVQTPNGERSTANRPRSLFDPVWRNAARMTASEQSQQPKAQNSIKPAVSIPTFSAQANIDLPKDDIIAKTSMTLPSFSGLLGLQPRQLSPLQAEKPAISVKDDKHASGQSLLTHRTKLLAEDQGAAPKELTASLVVKDTQPVKATTSSLKAVQLESPSAKENAIKVAEEKPPAPVPVSPSMMEHETSELVNPSLAPKPPGPFNTIALPESFLSMVPSTPTGTGALNAPAPQLSSTGALMVPVNGNDGQTGMLKLTQAVKVVKVPVAGQPGQYVTGLLPVLQQTPDTNASSPLETPNDSLKQKIKVAIVVILTLVVILTSGIYLLARTSSPQSTQTTRKVEVTPNVTATIIARATATAQANIILTDSLSQNSHNWIVGAYNNHIFGFEDDGAYHIANNSSNNLAIALLPDDNIPEPFAYTITLDEVKGDDVTVDPTKLNLFGLVLRYSQNDQNTQTFYCFEVKPTNNNAEYQFRKYDSSQSDPWSLLWHQPLGSEYHLGKGPANSNTIKVVANGPNFTFLVNGKQVGTVSDSSFQRGQIGMLVNQAGAEIAFSNLILTHS
jgi:serine/threonine protein kinase